MNTEKNRIGRIIKLAEMIVLAERSIKRSSFCKEKPDTSKAEHTVEFAKNLIYESLIPLQDYEREKILTQISYYSSSLQKNMGTDELWWIKDDISLTRISDPILTIEACNKVRSICEELFAETESPAM